MDDSSAVSWPRVGALLIVAAMVLSGIPSVKVGGAGTGSYPFEPISSAPAYTFADFAWADNGTMGMGVGNASGDGRTYRYEPRTGVWTPRAMSAIEGYNGIDYLSPLNYSEGFESGTSGWTFKNWQGALQWRSTLPTDLPTPSSGTPHPSAHGGTNVLWFGNTTTGDYNDNNHIVRGSAISPKITLSNTFTSFNLKFWHWWETEGNPYDVKYLYIKSVLTPTWTQVGVWYNSNTQWMQASVDLTAWKGATIQLNFTFDSGTNGSANLLCGWHVDDISVTSSNGAFVYVGTTTGGGFTAYVTDGYGTQTQLGSTTNFNDVAGGVKGDFLAVGPFGVAHYYNGTAWRSLSGIMAGATITACDFNGTLYFMVGYDGGGAGVSYFIGQDELDAGILAVHTITGTPGVKLWGFDWSNDVAGPDGGGFGAAAGTGNVYGMLSPEKWANVPTLSSPSQRYNSAMCYDATDDVVVMFGGNSGGIIGGTWEYSRNSGTWEYTAAGPSARQGARMVYAPTIDACVLFGGQTGGYVSDTWLYYPNNNSWFQKFPASSPPARANHGMAYLDAYGVVFLFGGYGGSSYDYLNDWWSYNPSTNIWTNLTDVEGPTKRNSMGFAYDSGSNRVVMFGGANSTLNSQTWTYSYASNSWTPMSPPSPPSARITSMVYDPNLGMTVLFGGSYGVTYYQDTWTYNYAGNRWTLVDCHAKPAKRFGHAMAYDSHEGRIVTFGGMGLSSEYMGDTWRFSSTSPWMGAASGLNGESFYDVEYSPEGDSALMVGHDPNTNVAVIYKWTGGGNGGSSLLMQPQDAELDDHILYCVEYNPTDAAGSAIAVGASAFAIWPNNVQTGSVTVDVIYSHVSYIDLYDAGTSTSRLNSQVDVDPGTNMVQYDLVVRAWNVLGQSNIATVDAYLYYDQGAEVEPSPFDMPGYENTRAHFRWTRGGVPEFEMIYPGAASDYETSIILGGCLAVDDVDGFNVTLRFRFSPHQQIRYANGGGTFVQSAGTRYDRAPMGWNAEDQSTTMALDDTGSWNIHVGVSDTGGNTAHAYDEYGIYMYTYVGTAGLPGGGSVYGSGPPSTSITLAPSNQDVTCCANTIYKMHVTVTDLVGVSSLVVIPKTALSVEGGYQHPAVAFDAIGTPIFLIGSSGVWANPQDEMRTTTTSTSDWDLDIDYVIWYCSIPAVPEDRYLGTATYSVVHT